MAETIKINNSKKISENYFSSDWNQNLSDRNSREWEKAILVINDRFQSRYLNPINELIKYPKKNIRTNIGFIVMSIDCLLIETLNQFYFGLKNTEEKYFNKNSNKKFKYNSQAFRDFFTHSTFFPVFKNQLDLIDLFYKDIRCGLLHQAETKANSLINIKEKIMVKPVDGKDFKNGIIINRNIFHKALSEEFDKYINDLNNPDSKNIEGAYLREMCNKKMVELI